MSLPDELPDAFPGAYAEDPAPAPDPAPDLEPGQRGAARPAARSAAADPSGPGPVPAAPVRPLPAVPQGTGVLPTPRTPQMGPEATDLPPLDRPDLPDLGAGTGPAEVRDLRLLSDVQVELAVELGRVRLPLRELLALSPGAVLELDRPADAPVDVLVNGHLVARGEVVVIDGEFGVRVTAVVQR